MHIQCRSDVSSNTNCFSMCCCFFSMCCCSTTWGLTTCKLQPLGGFTSSSQAPGRTLWTKGLFLAVLACFHKYNSEKSLITGNLPNVIETDFSLGFCFCVTHRYHQQLYWVGEKGELANRLRSENGAFQITFLWNVNVLESIEKLKKEKKTQRLFTQGCNDREEE